MDKNPLNVPQREVSGRTTIDKFDYQFHWALLQAFEYYKQNADFILCVEYHDDVLFVLSSNPDLPLDPSNDCIKLTQVKAFKNSLTNKKMISKTKKDPNSIIGKMILGVHNKKFENKVVEISLVSASGFSNIKHKDDNEYERISIKDIPDKDLIAIKNSVFNEFPETDEKKKEDIFNKIIFIKTILKEKGMREHLIGRIGEILDTKFQHDYYRVSNIYISLIDDLRKKCSIAYSYDNWYDFRNNKGLTNEDIEDVRNTHRKTVSKDVSSEIISELNIAIIKKMKLKKYFISHHNLLLDKAKNISEYNLYKGIQKMLCNHDHLLCDDLDMNRIENLKENLDEETLNLANDDNHLTSAIIYGIEKYIYA